MILLATLVLAQESPVRLESLMGLVAAMAEELVQELVQEYAVDSVGAMGSESEVKLVGRSSAVERYGLGGM